MKKKQIFTITALFAMLIVIPVVTTLLLNNGFELRISALESEEPANVVISDITTTSFRVIWITEKSVIGGVELEDGSKFVESKGTSFHSIVVTGLSAEETYRFKMVSAAKTYLNPSGNMYLATTSSVESVKSPYIIYGQVFASNGVSVQQSGLITIKLSSQGSESQIFGAVINENGGFQMDIGKALISDLSESFDYKRQVSVNVNVYVSESDEVIERTYSVDFSNVRQMPNIYLGENEIGIIPGVDGTN